jgi:hypothetical protein
LDSAFNIFYLISILLGVIGSGIVWLFNTGKNGAGTSGQVDVIRLSNIVREARVADRARLDALETEVDEMVTQLLDQGKGANTKQINIIRIVMRQLDKRREHLRSTN